LPLPLLQVSHKRRQLNFRPNSMVATVVTPTFLYFLVSIVCNWFIFYLFTALFFIVALCSHFVALSV